MKRKLAGLLLMIGGVFAGVASNGCIIAFLDEPSMPKYMIQK